jgi:hypothetical protein
VWADIWPAGVLALLVAAAPASITFLFGPPSPRIHDEFSNLLLADTLAHGRLANPTHPLWEHFESFHIIHRPTYASKYQPGQGAFLAFGRAVSGRPIVGAWVSLGLAAAALYWMLTAWLPRSWAFLGALLTFSRPGVVAWWGDSYWGGAVPALGGALAYGGAVRLWRETRIRDALAVGVGLILLGVSRPYEGAIAAVPVVVLLCLRGGRAFRAGQGASLARRVGIPLALCGTLGVGALGIYNRAITGKAWLMPYAVYERTYSYVPLLCFGELRAPPEYRHEAMRRFYATLVAPTYRTLCGSNERWSAKWARIEPAVFGFYLGVILWLPAIVGLLTRRYEAWLMTAACLCVLLANLASSWAHPHYFAPAAACLGGLTALGLHRIASLSWRWHFGRLVALPGSVRA